MNKRLKRILAAVSAVSLMSSLSAMSMSAFAENEELTISKDYINKINADYEANKDDTTVIDADYIKNMTEQEYKDRYGDVCEEDLFYTCMGAEISVVDENGEPFENLEVKFIECVKDRQILCVDDDTYKYKVIESWNTSDEPVKKILVEDMMIDNSKDKHYYSIIVDVPEGYTYDLLESYRENLIDPPTQWVYCMTDVMSVQQTKHDNSIANLFGLERYYQHHEIEVIPETLYQQRWEEEFGRSWEDKYNFSPCISDYAEIAIASLEPTLAGDANEDGKVSIADAILIMQALSNPDEYRLTQQGRANADIVGDGDGITAMDALRIQEIELGL